MVRVAAYDFDEQAIAKTRELYLWRHLAPIGFGDGFISFVSEYLGASATSGRHRSARTSMLSSTFIDLSTRSGSRRASHSSSSTTTL